MAERGQKGGFCIKITLFVQCPKMCQKYFCGFRIQLAVYGCTKWQRRIFENRFCTHQSGQKGSKRVCMLKMTLCRRLCSKDFFKTFCCTLIACHDSQSDGSGFWNKIQFFWKKRGRRHQLFSPFSLQFMVPHYFCFWGFLAVLLWQVIEFFPFVQLHSGACLFPAYSTLLSEQIDIINRTSFFTSYFFIDGSCCLFLWVFNHFLLVWFLFGTSYLTFVCSFDVFHNLVPFCSNLCTNDIMPGAHFISINVKSCWPGWKCIVTPSFQGVSGPFPPRKSFFAPREK